MEYILLFYVLKILLPVVLPMQSFFEFFGIRNGRAEILPEDCGLN
jgi:hypothetical protein